MPDIEEGRSFLGVERSACGRAWRDRLDERGAARALAIAQRHDDVPELLAYFADQFATRDNLPYRRFSTAAQNRLRLHGWPGNLRELRNLVQRLLILGGAGNIEVPEVEQALGASLAPPRPARGGDFAID